MIFKTKNHFYGQLIKGVIIIMTTFILSVITLVMLIIPRQMADWAQNYLYEIAEYINQQNIYLILVDDRLANEELIKSLIGIPDINYASISNIESGNTYQIGETEWKSTSNIDTQQYHTTRHQIHLKQPIYYNIKKSPTNIHTKKIIGYLHLALDRNSHQKQLWLIIYILLGSAITGLLLNIPFIIRYSEKHSGPVSSLKEQISQLDVTNKSKRRIKLHNVPEEFNTIEASINEQMANFSRFYDYQEQQIKERTDKLNLALQKAEQAERSKSALMANLSHDLKTPLTAVKGFIELCKEEMTYGDSEASLEALNNAQTKKWTLLIGQKVLFYKCVSVGLN